MAIERDINKKKKEREPAQKATPARPFKKQGLRSPTYTKRNPHRDSGDKKPSLKTKASIIKEKAKKGQGLARGGMIKSIIRIPPLPSPQPTPRSGVISTIDKGIRKPRPAEKFVKIRERINKLGGYAMGGQAQEGAARGRVFADQKARDRRRLMDMLDRLKKKPGGTRPKNPKTKKFDDDLKRYMERPILPKDKPKPKPVRPFMPKGKPKGKPKRAK